MNKMFRNSLSTLIYILLNLEQQDSKEKIDMC